MQALSPIDDTVEFGRYGFAPGPTLLRFSAVEMEDDEQPDGWSRLTKMEEDDGHWRGGAGSRRRKMTSSRTGIGWSRTTTHGG
jgi:hypothetical protein